MRNDHTLEEVRRAGARRRALDEGREPLPEPDPAPPASADVAGSVCERPTAAPEGAADGTALPSGSASAGTAGAPAAAAVAAPAVGRGAWFDARAFFLGWLAMIAALIAGASGVLTAAAGFAVAFALARRSRLANAVGSIAGAAIAVAAGVVILAVIGLVLAD